MSYCGLDDILARVGSGDDQLAQIQSLIAAATAEIDRWCGRRFTLDGALSARIYAADPHHARLWVDDISDLTDFALKTDDNGDGVYETTWASTDFLLEPPNQILDGIEGHPYVSIVALQRPWPYAWFHPLNVQITAKWGWLAVPEAVKATAIELVTRSFLTPTGVRNESVGGYSVGYDTASAGITLAESDEERLSHYRKTWQ